KPFYYAVHKASLLSVDQVENHLASCHAIALENDGNGKTDYFGLDPFEPPVRLSDSERDTLFDGRFVSAAFKTSEVAIDPQILAASVRTRIASESKIQCR